MPSRLYVIPKAFEFIHPEVSPRTHSLTICSLASSTGESRSRRLNLNRCRSCRSRCAWEFFRARDSYRIARRWRNLGRRVARWIASMKSMGVDFRMRLASVSLPVYESMTIRRSNRSISSSLTPDTLFAYDVVCTR
jgi:hypothetical protein